MVSTPIAGALGVSPERGRAAQARACRSKRRSGSSGRGRDRTGDTRIFSPLLYQLSYPSGRAGSCPLPRLLRTIGPRCGCRLAPAEAKGLSLVATTQNARPKGLGDARARFRPGLDRHWSGPSDGLGCPARLRKAIEPARSSNPAQSARRFQPTRHDRRPVGFAPRARQPPSQTTHCGPPGRDGRRSHLAASRTFLPMPAAT